MAKVLLLVGSLGDGDSYSQKFVLPLARLQQQACRIRGVKRSRLPQSSAERIPGQQSVQPGAQGGRLPLRQGPGV